MCLISYCLGFCIIICIWEKCCKAPSIQTDSNIVWTFADDRIDGESHLQVKPGMKDQASMSNLNSEK